jgi:hypothetical protein
MSPHCIVIATTATMVSPPRQSSLCIRGKWVLAGFTDEKGAHSNCKVKDDFTGIDSLLFYSLLQLCRCGSAGNVVPQIPFQWFNAPSVLRSKM